MCVGSARSSPPAASTRLPQQLEPDVCVIRWRSRAPADRGNAPYQLTGLFYEACDCYTICPCWLGDDPDDGECTGVFAWDIEQGTIDGVDVSGLRAVSVSHHSGLREEAKQRVVIFVDDRATRQQTDAIAAAFSGRLGGPLQELADILGELLAVERAPIVLRREGRLTTLTVDRRIRVEGTTKEGPSGRPIGTERWKVEQRPRITGGGGRERPVPGRAVALTAWTSMCVDAAR